MKKIIALVVGAVILIASSITLVSKENVKVGYLLVGPKNDGGWSMRHNQGFESLTKYGYKVSGIEMAPEAEAAKLLGKLARKNDIVLQRLSVTWMEWRRLQRNILTQFSCTLQDTRVTILTLTTTVV